MTPPDGLSLRPLGGEMKEEEEQLSPVDLDLTVGNKEWKQSTRGGMMLQNAGPEFEGKHARSSSTRASWDPNRWLQQYVMTTMSMSKIMSRNRFLRSTLAR